MVDLCFTQFDGSFSWFQANLSWHKLNISPNSYKVAFKIFPRYAKKPCTIKNFVQNSFKNELTLGFFFLHPYFQFSYILTYARSKSCCINWGETVRFARKCQEKCTMVFIEINWLHFSHLTLNCQNKCTNLWRCHVMSVLSSQVSNAMYAQGESYWSWLFLHGLFELMIISIAKFKNLSRACI